MIYRVSHETEPTLSVSSSNHAIPGQPSPSLDGYSDFVVGHSSRSVNCWSSFIWNGGEAVRAGSSIMRQESMSCTSESDTPSSQIPQWGISSRSNYWSPELFPQTLALRWIPWVSVGAWAFGTVAYSFLRLLEVHLIHGIGLGRKLEQQLGPICPRISSFYTSHFQECSHQTALELWKDLSEEGLTVEVSFFDFNLEHTSFRVGLDLLEVL